MYTEYCKHKDTSVPPTGLNPSLLPSSDSAIALTAPELAGIHDILSTFDTTSSVIPPFGADYDALTVDSRLWMTHETDYSLGYNSELIKDRNYCTDTNLDLWVLRNTLECDSVTDLELIQKQA